MHAVPGGGVAGPTADRRVGGVATALLGSGVALVLAGGASGSLPLAAAGAVVAGSALIVLMGAGWIDVTAVVAIAAPLPAIWSGGGLRIAGAAPIAAAAVSAWVLHRGIARTRLGTGALPLRTFGVLALVLVLATAAAAHPSIALRKLGNLAVLGALLFALTDLLTGNEPRRRLATVLAAVAAGCGALAVLEAGGVIPGAFPNWGTSFNRAALGFGQPNGLGLYLAVLLPLVAWRAGEARGAARWAWMGALASAAAGLLATFSRGSWGALVLGAGALAIAGDWRRSLRLLGGILLAAGALDVLTGGLVRDRITATIGDWVVEQRAALMLAGVLMFLDRPLLGFGPGGYEAELDRYGIQVPELWDFKATPHNAYVQMAAETGIGGLVLYVAVLALFMRAAARAVRSAPSERDAALERALLWSLGVVAVSGLSIWPYALDTGQAVIGVFALVAAAPVAGQLLAAARARAPASSR